MLDVRDGAPDVVQSILAFLSTRAPHGWSSTVVDGGRAALRYLSAHTGVPALLVAAVLVCVGYRVLKRSLRFALEVAAVALALGAATQLGWLTW